MNFVTNVIKKYIQNEPQPAEEVPKQPDVVPSTSENKENGFSHKPQPETAKPDVGSAEPRKPKLRLSFLQAFDPLYSESSDKPRSTSGQREPISEESESPECKESPKLLDVSEDESAYVDASASYDDIELKNPVAESKNVPLEESLLKFYTPEKGPTPKQTEEALESPVKAEKLVDQPEESKVVDLPEKVDAPTQVEPKETADSLTQVAPETVDFPTQVEVPETVDSPTQVEALITVDSPTQVAPETVDSPSQVEAPETVDSPTQVAPETVDISTQVESLERVDSLTQVESSEKVDHPTEVESSGKVDSSTQVEPLETVEHPTQVELAKTVDSSTQAESAQKVDLPTRFEPSEKVDFGTQFEESVAGESSEEVESPSQTEESVVGESSEVESPTESEESGVGETSEDTESPRKVDSPTRIKESKVAESPEKVRSPKLAEEGEAAKSSGTVDSPTQTGKGKAAEYIFDVVGSQSASSSVGPSTSRDEPQAQRQPSGFVSSGITESDLISALSRKLSGEYKLIPARSKFTLTETEFKKYVLQQRLCAENNPAPVQSGAVPIDQDSLSSSNEVSGSSPGRSSASGSRSDQPSTSAAAEESKPREIGESADREESSDDSEEAKIRQIEDRIIAAAPPGTIVQHLKIQEVFSGDSPPEIRLVSCTTREILEPGTSREIPDDPSNAVGRDIAIVRIDPTDVSQLPPGRRRVQLHFFRQPQEDETEDLFEDDSDDSDDSDSPRPPRRFPVIAVERKDSRPSTAEAASGSSQVEIQAHAETEPRQAELETGESSKSEEEAQPKIEAEQSEELCEDKPESGNLEQEHQAKPESGSTQEEFEREDLLEDKPESGSLEEEHQAKPESGSEDKPESGNLEQEHQAKPESGSTQEEFEREDLSEDKPESGSLEEEHQAKPESGSVQEESQREDISQDKPESGNLQEEHQGKPESECVQEGSQREDLLQDKPESGKLEEELQAKSESGSTQEESQKEELPQDKPEINKSDEKEPESVSSQAEEVKEPETEAPINKTEKGDAQVEKQCSKEEKGVEFEPEFESEQPQSEGEKLPKGKTSDTDKEPKQKVLSGANVDVIEEASAVTSSETSVEQETKTEGEGDEALKSECAAPAKPDEEHQLDSGLDSIEDSYPKSSKSPIEDSEDSEKGELLDVFREREDSCLPDENLDHTENEPKIETKWVKSSYEEEIVGDAKRNEQTKLDAPAQPDTGNVIAKSEDLIREPTINLTDNQKFDIKASTDIDTYKIKMADLSEKLSEQQQENSELKLQLNAIQQAKASLELEIRQKEEIIIKKEAESLKNEQSYKQEIKQLREKLKENSKLIEKDSSKELEEQLKEAKAREAKAIAELTQKTKDQANYEKLLEDYDNTLATRFADYQKLNEEHETLTRHLANIELAFSDLHQKYERTKTIIEKFKSNEEALVASLDGFEKTCKQHEERYECLKAHAESQIEKCNKEILALRDKYEVDINKLKAIIKRLEIKCSSLDVSLQQKTEECTALAALCDEVTGKKV